MQNWYLVMAKPKQDEIAEWNLQQQNYEVYRPKIWLRKKRRGAFVSVEESLFPRYLFVHLCDENQNWSPIRSTKGVLQIVRFGLQPARVDDALIESIRARESIATQHIEEANRLKKGQKVKVQEAGAFYGIEGLFQCYDADQRVIILMNLLGSQQPISLPKDSIEVC